MLRFYQFVPSVRSGNSPPNLSAKVHYGFVTPLILSCGCQLEFLSVRWIPFPAFGMRLHGAVSSLWALLRKPPATPAKLCDVCLLRRTAMLWILAPTSWKPLHFSTWGQQSHFDVFPFQLQALLCTICQVSQIHQLSGSVKPKVQILFSSAQV